MEARNHFTKRAATTLVALLLLSLTALAQERRSEISLEGTGFFSKDSNGNGVGNQATETGGLLVGYRYDINHWLAAEANYGYDRNTQLYSGSVPSRVQANIHQITGSAVVKLPAVGRVLPFVLGGGGALIFDPTGNPGGAVAGATEQGQGTFLYGGGADYVFSRRLLLRMEYRGLVYKAPSFNVAGLNTDTWTHAAQPSAGFVFRF